MDGQPEFGRKSKDRYGPGCTPFRYPGGKAFLADVIEQRIVGATGAIKAYAEPYAGGAGAAVELLARGAVERIVLNDFDRRVYAAWWAILHRTDAFIDRVLSTPVTMESWYSCREIVAERSDETSLFELGFATYFLNRTNHSGVILGAGPIGGYSQAGKWLIDARYYADTMVRRIRWLGERRDRIFLHNVDGLDFLRSFDEQGLRTTFFLIDPPYVMAGKKLYLDAMSSTKHQDLARFLTDGNSIPHWLVTYDDCDLIERAYSAAQLERLPVRYTLHNKRVVDEICVSPRYAA